ncbi:AI-2E family transporter [Pseudoclavibacter chungangensis]|uniref:AI-2E family transporter n=1 Tax=Pseudoclavibacter chungangensis TaxID=587635 RepID=A0A7J5BUE5_9MICO|nr:AI-2E family transporter [Pseudoclavibacter chungangensis]KAB1657932.1 AI-2E family transporter [Pseudoclavibacter chungangensis]NYJ65918.1 putative PurR-regulated permease PerM [Pseudoclavibacter chungangensis]
MTTSTPDGARTGSTRASHPDDGIGPSTGEAALVPRGMRIAGAYSWRFVAIVLALVPIGWLIAQAKIIVIPVLVAALLASLLSPLMKWLMHRARFPKWAALVVTLLVLFTAVSVLIYLVITQFASGLRFDVDAIQTQYQDFLALLENSWLHVTQEQITQATSQAISWFQSNVTNLLSSAVSAGSTAVAIATGALVTLFTLIFYLLDGRVIWLFIVTLFPRAARAAVDGAGLRGWESIGHYVRVQIVVALINAVGIGIGAAVLQVPFAIPIAIIVFLASFVPFVGAFASGTLAVVIALGANGLVNALIMLVIVVGVMQLESHVLQPLIMGNAVKVHPLGVLLAVSAGSIFGGIAGAVFAVPLVASAKVVVQYIASGEWHGLPDPTKVGRPPEPKPNRIVARVRETRGTDRKADPRHDEHDS